MSCSRCGLRIYSAARYSTRDDCPRCLRKGIVVELSPSSLFLAKRPAGSEAIQAKPS
jgi:hypothetical protein